MPAKPENEAIAQAIYDLSKSIRLLGNGNIERGDNSPGAVEGLAMLIRDTGEKTATALGDIAMAIRELAETLQDRENK